MITASHVLIAGIFFMLGYATGARHIAEFGCQMFAALTSDLTDQEHNQP